MYELGVVVVRAVFDGTRMRQIAFTNTEVASNETARNIDRGVVPTSSAGANPFRADLARISGLQRSTVSLITEQLIRETWGMHGPTGRLPRGRRPTFLRLNELRGIVVADLDPSKSLWRWPRLNGRLLSHQSFSTPNNPQLAMTNRI